MRGGHFRNPVLIFKNGTALSPYKAFMQGFKPLKGPRRIRILLLAEKDRINQLLNLLKNLKSHIGTWLGFETTFQCKLEYDMEKICLDRGIEGLEKKVSKYDIILAAIPDEEFVDYENDPYYPLKRQLALLGIPSQMVAYTTLEYLSNRSYILYNIGLAIYAKVGGIPWGIAGKTIADIYIGLDIAGGYATATIITDWWHPKITWNIIGGRHVEIIENVGKLLAGAIERRRRTLKGKIRRIVIHRDGLFHQKEINMIREELDILAAKGIIDKNYEYYLIEIRKRCVARFIRALEKHYYTPEKGVYLELSPHKYIISTTGYPDMPLTILQSPPRPIIVELVETNNWEINFKEFAREVYWLTHLHYASAFRTPKLPITTLYSHRISSFANAGVIPHEKLLGKYWFL